MARSKRRFSLDDSDDDIDLTPMIDIVFLLIAFFMVVAKLIDDTKVDIIVPYADQSKIAEKGEEQPTRITMTVDANGKSYFGPNPLNDPKDLTPLIKSTLRAKGENIVMFVRADAKTPHKYVRDVLKAIAEGGVFDVKFAAYENK